jgi:hypothetical protein
MTVPAALYPIALYHITARRNDRKEILRSDDDRSASLSIPAQAVEHYRFILLRIVRFLEILKPEKLIGDVAVSLIEKHRYATKEISERKMIRNDNSAVMFFSGAILLGQ